MVPVDKTKEILAALVGFDTVSRNSNLPLIAWIEDYLGRLGVPSRRIPDATGSKANLWATIGPTGVPGTILSGHTDVVPVDGQTWASDPFRLAERGGRLYGRGAADMKGFDACCLAAVPAMLAEPLARPIHLSFSHDEEVGCVGVRSLIAVLPQEPAMPSACIVGEPTGMNVVIGHKGKRSFRVTVSGRTCHSSLAPHGVNAVEYAARLIVQIREIGKRLENHGPRDPLYDVPFSTAHTGVVQGGTALNIVPDACTFEFEFRAIAADDIDALGEEAMAYARNVLEPEMRGRARGGHRVRAEIRLPRPRHAGGRSRDRAGEDPERQGRAREGGLWHRGGPVRRRRHPVGGDRPRLDRPGAQGRRVHRRRRVGEVRRVPRQADRA